MRSGWKLGVAAAILAGGLTFSMSMNVNAAEEELAITRYNFPDEKFRSYVKDNCDKDKSGGLSKEELDAVTEINIDATNVDSLQGIELFEKLNTLEISNYSQPQLNLSKNTDVYSGPNWGIIPGGEETAAEPVEFSKTTHTTAVEQPEGLEDISGYQNTDAQGNPTNTNYTEQVGYDDAKKEEDAKRREREAEQGNPNQPFIPADALPPSGDDSNDLEI